MNVEISDQTKYRLVGFLRTYPKLYWASLVPIALIYFYPMVSLITAAGIFGYVLTILLIMEGRIPVRDFVKMIFLPPDFNYYGIERIVLAIVLYVAISANAAKMKIATIIMVVMVMFILNWARYLDPDSETYWDNNNPIDYEEDGLSPQLISTPLSGVYNIGVNQLELDEFETEREDDE